MAVYFPEKTFNADARQAVIRQKNNIFLPTSKKTKAELNLRGQSLEKKKKEKFFPPDSNCNNEASAELTIICLVRFLKRQRMLVDDFSFLREKTTAN